MEAITFEDFALLMIGVIGVSMIIGGFVRWIIMSIR